MAKGEENIGKNDEAEQKRRLIARFDTPIYADEKMLGFKVYDVEKHVDNVRISSDVYKALGEPAEIILTELGPMNDMGGNDVPEGILKSFLNTDKNYVIHQKEEKP